MFLAKVIGQIVSTKKEPVLTGRRLVILRPLLVDAEDPSKLREGSNTVVAIDTLHAGTDSVVLFAQGSSARQVEGLKGAPVDASVVGIVDSVNVLGKPVYRSSD